MDPKIVAEIEKMVETMFSKKEDAERRQAVTKALEDAKVKLESAAKNIEEKDVEIAELQAKLGEVEAELAEYKDNNKELSELKDELKAKEEEIASVKEEFDTLKIEKEEADKKLEEKDIEISTIKEEHEKVATELAAIKTEQLVASRMSELEKEGIAREGEGREIQEAKLKDMSDEEFASYKDELTDIKKAIASKLSNNDGNPNPKDTAGLNVETPPSSGDDVSVEEIGKAFCDVFGISK